MKLRCKECGSTDAFIQVATYWELIDANGELLNVKGSEVEERFCNKCESYDLEGEEEDE